MNADKLRALADQLERPFPRWDDRRAAAAALRALPAENAALREEVRRLREALERIAVTAHRGRDWMQAHARAALAERSEGQEVGG